MNRKKNTYTMKKSNPRKTIFFHDENSHENLNVRNAKTYLKITQNYARHILKIMMEVEVSQLSSSACFALAGRPLLRFWPKGMVFASGGALTSFRRICMPNVCLQIDFLR